MIISLRAAALETERRCFSKAILAPMDGMYYNMDILSIQYTIWIDRLWSQVSADGGCEGDVVQRMNI